MDEVMDMREDGTRGVAIRRQRRRFPFEIFNTLLTVICLASAVLVVYKLLQPRPREEGMGQFRLVIHAEALKITADKVELNSNNIPWVKNNSIYVPCDGIYLLYAQVTTVGNKTQVFIEKTTHRSRTTKWSLGNTTMNSPLLMTSLFRRNNIIYMRVNNIAKINQAETFMGIVLLKALQDEKSCQEKMQMKL